jgi:hypothetical protein
MRVSDLVGFKRELFFEGAVQVGWVDSNSKRAELAATTFVFHGPEFHGVKKEDVHTEQGGESLTDTATFVANIVDHITNSEKINKNPFSLAIAGYGSGKSHLAVTLDLLLADHSSDVSKTIVNNLASIDAALARKVSEALSKVSRPYLVIALDGMSNFDLGVEFTKKVIAQLKARELDMFPIDELSPRFKIAEEFVLRNYIHRKEEFSSAFGSDATPKEIAAKLSSRDEEVYNGVTQIYESATGRPIPIDGQDSPQTLITTICKNYCGSDGPFAGLVILFDEFGRFLEFAVDKPHLAGDYALQQIYQGVQDNIEQCHFLGLIQYDLKTYLSRTSKQDAAKLQRYISRYDSATKSYLSSNLETLIAHLILRKDEKKVKEVTVDGPGVEHWRSVHKGMAARLTGFDKYSIWSSFTNFLKVIVEGCWPLHPLTVWMLSRQQNIVQNRSAISFIAAEIDKCGNQEIDPKAPFSIHAADLCLGPMFEEILAADRVQHGVIAEAFASVRERHAARLTSEHNKVLAAIVVSQKIRLKFSSQTDSNEALTLLTGLTTTVIEQSTRDLSRTFGVLEWNEDLRQYDIIPDNVPRSQFSHFLHKKLTTVNSAQILELFQAHGKNWGVLEDAATDFADQNGIATSEWNFATSCATSRNIDIALRDGVSRWKQALAPDESRGQLIYYLVEEANDIDKIRSEVQAKLSKEVEKHHNLVPIFCVMVHDAKGDVAENLSKLNILENRLTDDERNTYRQFIEDEKNTCREHLRNALATAIKERDYVFPPQLDIGAERISVSGSQLFAAIYKKVIPFPFDGFATVRGNASKDCGALIRAVTLKQMSANWIAAQVPQTKNRTLCVLDRSWQVLNSEHQISGAPKLKAVREIFERFDAELETTKRINLGKLFESMLMPPYGMNTASGGLMLSIFLGKSHPSKGLVLDGSPISPEEWVEAAVGKKNTFDLAVLKKTEVVFISEDLSAQWKHLLDDWEEERDYLRILKFDQDAGKLRSTANVPTEHQDRLRMLSAQASNVAQKIRDFETKYGEYRDSIGTYEHKGELRDLLFVAKKTIRHFKEMSNDPSGQWPESLIAKLDEILKYSKAEFAEHFPAWLKKQTCADPRQVADFRHKLTLNGDLMKDLGLSELKVTCEEHYQRINSQVEQRAKFAGAQDKAYEFLKIAQPLETMPQRKLEDHIKEGQAITSTLSELQKQINADDIKELSERMTVRVQQFKEIQRNQRERLSALTNHKLESLQDVSDSLVEVRKLRSLFADREEDLAYLNEIQSELCTYENDFAQWANNEFSPEEIEQSLRKRLVERENERAEKQEPYNWEIEEVYLGFLDLILAELRNKAQAWLSNAVPSRKDIESLSAHTIDKFVSKLRQVPGYLSEEDRAKIRVAENLLQKRQSELDEERSKDWVSSNVPSEPELSQLDQTSITKRLDQLQQAPNWLSEDAGRAVRGAIESLEAQLDQLDFNNLVERIRRLPGGKQRQLLLELQATIKA